METYKAIFIGGKWDGYQIEIARENIQESIVLKFNRFKPYANNMPECTYNLSYVDDKSKCVFYRLATVMR